MSIYYKFVAVRQEGFPIPRSSPRLLSVRFFFRHWMVSTKRCLLVWAVWHGHDVDTALQPRRFQVFYHTSIFEHALLHEFHGVFYRSYSRGVYCFPCLGRPNSVSKSTC
jgi:hypothetical protein